MAKSNTYTSTVTVKGQVTIPARLRNRFNIEPADRVMFVERGGTLQIEPLPTIESLAGSLENKSAKPLTDRKMREIRQKGALFSAAK